MQGERYESLRDQSITHLESHLLDFHRALSKDAYIRLIARQADVTIDSEFAFFSFNQRVLTLFPEHVIFFSDSNGTLLSDRLFRLGLESNENGTDKPEDVGQYRNL